MKKYRKKPVEIEALEWTGENLREVISETGLHQSAAHMKWEEYAELVGREGFKLWTLEGPLIVPVYHWIIKGHTEKLGYHFWPVDPNYFFENYEPVQTQEKR
jgi:hypothetical protein